MTTIEEHCTVFDPSKPRPVGLSAFDASAVMGVNNHKSNIAVWAEKTGKIPYDGPKFSKARANLRRTVAQMYAEERNAVVAYWPCVVRSNSFDFMQYRFEYVLLDRPDLESGIVHDFTDSTGVPSNIVAILDVHAVGISGPASTYEWDDDSIPPKYEAQGLHAVVVTGINRVVYTALIANEGLVVRTRNYEQDDTQALIEAEFGFWEDVETKTEPPVLEGDESTLKAIRTMYPKQIDGTSVTLEGEQINLYHQWLNAKEMSETSEKLATLLRAQLELIVKDAESIIVDGKVVVTYKKSKDGTTFDTKAFKEAHPEFIDEFTIPTVGSRSWTRKK